MRPLTAGSEMEAGELWMRAILDVVEMERRDERTAIRLEVRRGRGIVTGDANSPCQACEMARQVL